MKVLEVVACRISVVKALVAKASGPGFYSPATTKIASHFSFTFFWKPKVSIYLSSFIDSFNYHYICLCLINVAFLLDHLNYSIVVKVEVI